ncbi:MAG: aminomethyl-transferring glycine dehydrogenase subunit GcvPB [Candidatus Firestonebacteria bacterium]
MKLIFEKSKTGRKGYSLPKTFIYKKNLIPDKFLRKINANLPEVSEPQVVRHYTRLSQRNIGVDSNFYPLGSCTMKYNPKINEEISSLSGFTKIHPYQEENTVQGALRVIYELGEYLKEISGLDGITFQPAAGAHGEITGLLMAKAYHKDKGRQPKKVLVTDTSHGTNPASASLVGYNVVTVHSKNGFTDIDDLRSKLDEDTAVFMITIPNTLGIFEKDIVKISEMVHKVKGLMYMDGANLNAILGITKPADFGIDIMHFNLHKTFSTPHGGGGPGAGPVAVREFLKEYLPYPVVDKKDDKFIFNYNIPKSIGKVRNFYGNFNVLVKAYIYLKLIGKEGIKEVSKLAVLNANYLKEILKKYFNLPYNVICKHEFVLSMNTFKDKDVRAIDIAKRLLDYGFHPPTIYFPLIVEEAFMIEPTETEDKETLDEFIESLINIKKEIEENPEVVKNAPQTTPIRRVNEVQAARNPILKYEKK